MKTKLLTIDGEKVLCRILEEGDIIKKGDIVQRNGKIAQWAGGSIGCTVPLPTSNGLWKAYRLLKRKSVKKVAKSQVKAKPSHFSTDIQFGYWYYETRGGIQVYFDNGNRNVKIPWSKILRSLERCKPEHIK